MFTDIEGAGNSIGNSSAWRISSYEAKDEPHPFIKNSQAYLYNHKTKGRRTFLQDQQSSSTRLPRILPKGLPYAANFISFEELLSRGTLQTCSQEEVDFSVNDLKILYQAKCLDQGLSPSWEREMRFMELISSNCKGTFFCLRESGLGPMSAEAIAHILSSNTKYIVLDLSGNRLLDEGACLIAKLIRINKTLVHVGLRSNDIGHVGGEALANALLQNNTIVSLDLGAHSGINGNHIATEGAKAIGNVLRANKVLSHLNLSCNGLGHGGISFIAEGLDGNCSLTHLDISVNNLGYMGAKVIADALENCNITHLSLQRNNLTDSGGAVLFEAITAAVENGEDRIEYLNVESNDLGVKSAKAIQRMLGASSSMKQLRVSLNCFGPSSKYIIEGLADNKGLQSLYMASCGIRETDGQPFTTGLAVNSTLQHLDLSHNRLRDAATTCIAEAMKSNKGLINLDLSCNNIMDEGGAAIAMFLKCNTSLRVLKLRRNCMSSVTGDLLDEQLRCNKTIEKMDVTYNDFRYKCLIGIRATLAKNAEANKALAVPKLRAEVEGLSFKEKELAQAEDEIEMERRIIKDRSEQLLRRKEEARVAVEKSRREIVDVEKTLAAVQSRLQTAEELLHRTEERVSHEMTTINARVSNMEARLQQEKDRLDRANREMDRMRRQIKQLEEAEAARLRPLLMELDIAESDRDREAKACRYESDKLATLELTRKELEMKLGISGKASAARPTPTKSPSKKRGT
uniref:Ribonuclease inhibitor-like protein n=1 Tax=Trypanosoma congolense (strain IL3000) TaxID=1068625 RepID=G0UK51_TRYCI|nr:ribonuclease inhibitor-like protein [Trypanosoma congolense IL3000]